MIARSLVSDFIVPLFGALICAAPAITRPTLQFGVRVPGERTGAPVIQRERRSYYWRTATVAVCATALALLIGVAGGWWQARLVLLLEVAADLGCYVLARKKIAAAKDAEDWFAGRRQTVVADTSWRTDPPKFPVLWLLPAVAVLVATAVVGALRYPDLPARVATGYLASGRLVPKSGFGTFALVIGQLYVIVLWTGLMLLAYRARPDLDTADPAASAARYRRFLTAFARAALTMVALVNVTLLLVALARWRVYHLSGASAVLPVLPFAAGVLILVAVALRAGQAGSRLRGSAGPAPAAGTDRDDDRLWKAGLLYVNRNDPAVVVGARFGVGWTLNFGNPTAWACLAAIVAMPAGLAAIGLAAGM